MATKPKQNPQKPPVTPVPTPADQLQIIQKRAIPVELLFHMPVNRRQVKRKDNITIHKDDGSEATTDKNALYVSKSLLNSKEYKALSSFKSSVKSFMNSQAVPTKIRMGAFMVRYTNLTKVDLALVGFEKGWNLLVAEFIAAYPALKEKAKEDLDVLYDEADYPAPEVLKESFGFEYKYFSYGVPEDLKEFNIEVFRREEKRVSKDIQNAIEEMKALLRTGLAEILKKAVSKLAPAEDGKEKVFKKGTLDRLEDFLKLFEARDVTDDRQLGKLVSDLKKVVGNVTPDDLKASEQIRSEVKASFEVVAAELDTLIVKKPGRMVLLDDGKEAA